MKKFTLLMFASLLSICGYAQLSLETFESVWTGTPAAPSGWTVVNEVGPNFTWARSNPAQVPSYAGTYAAYLQRENTSTNAPMAKDWLITPYFNMPANAQLRFYSRLTVPLDQGGIYKVKISTDSDPNNLAAYTDLQTWTELQLNPVQTDYVEKVITLPPLTGNVHIAFVMEGDDMDRWLIDNVKVVSQCFDPSGLTVSNATLTTAQFNWTNTGNAPSWEIEVTTDVLPFTGVGTPYTGPPTIVWENLQPDTTYKVYLRGICSDSGTSSWIGPIFFNTAAVGESCSYPLVTTPPPYTTTNNTSNFADNYEGSAGATASCGNVTGTYLSGNDVVYEFTPVTSGNVNISLTNTGTGAGMFIYDDCASIGVTCIGGGTGNATIPSLAVTAGNSIYIVISTNGSASTTPYTLSIQQVSCAAPTGLASANPTASSADLSWAAGTATAWQLAVQPSGTGLPTGAGVSVTSNNVTASQTVTGANLNPATSYEYYVRANCGDGTFSIWTGPFIFTTTQEPAIINYTQNWETAPHNWTLNNGTQVNKWVVGNAVNNGGSQSLYISNDNGVNNMYTITAASVVQAYRDVTIPAGVTSLNLAFDWKSIGESADYIRAYLVPVTFIPTPGTQIVGSATNVKIGADLFSSPGWSTFNGIINVTGMTGARRLVLEWRNTASLGSQPPAAIDNINLSIITCPAPTAPTVVAGTLTNSSVNVSWTAPTSIPPGYDYYVSNTPTAPVAATAPTGTAATTTATGVVLQPSFTHYFWVRANCGPGDTSTWAGPLTIIAPQIPADLEYNQNFDLGAHSFSLNNGTQANKWVVGSATSNSTPNSLYVSQDNGVTNSYNTTSTSIVQAYRDIQMPATLDQLILTYDWKNIGEANDYFRVWLVPVAFNPTAGTQITAAADRIQLGGNFTGTANTWATQTNVIQASTYGNSIRRLVFEWRNDGTNGNQPPAAIDNINLKVAPCPQPSALAITALSSPAATFTWTAPASGAPASGYEYYLSTDTTAPTAATVATNGTTPATVTLNNLPPSTNYNIWVRSNCGTSKSLWIGPVNFTTPQIPAPMNYVQNFDSAGPYIWDFVNGTQANKWAIGGAVSNTSPNSLYITTDSGVTNTYNVTSASVVHAYRDIQLPAAVDQVLLSFDWKNLGQANTDYFRVWMVPVDYTIVAGQQITAGTGRVQIGGNFGQNGSWSTSNNLMSVLAYQNQTRRLVFEWRNDAATGTQPPAAIDNINFSVVTCPAPTNLLMPSNNTAGTTFTWTPPSSVTPTFDFYYSASSTPPGTATTPSGNVPTPTVTLSGLADSTNYYFWVRDNCGPGDTSLWTGPFEFSTPQVASPLDYVQNFDGNTYGWTIANGNQPNKWMVGTDASSSPGKSLYISNNGATNTYTNNLASVVHAYKDFIIPPGATALELSFDWRNLGENNWDYIRVYRVPTNYVPTTGTQMTAAADREKIGGDLVGNANWTTATYTLNSTAYANTNVRLVFEWRDDTSGGTNPPAAIDNVNFSVITCPKPIALGVTAPTQTGATFNWTEAATAGSWEVYVVEAGQPAPTAASEGVPAGATTFPYTTPALQPSTNYVYYVRAVCGPNDKSRWSGPVAFKTAIGNDECTGAYTVQVNALGDDCAQFANVSYLGATASAQAYDCGGVNGGDVWYQFVATEDRLDIQLSNFADVTPISPIVIALYQGDQCGSLLQVACSTTNFLMAKNLIVGATYKVRIYINQASPNLNTAFRLCVNTPAPPQSANPSACTITTPNYSFENPTHTNGTIYPMMFNHNIVQGWRTTAADQIMEFWNNGNYENVPAYDGNQFVELNANLISGLYQDYETPQSTTFTYSFAHRGRMGVDSCKLLAGAPNDIYTEVTTATTGKDGWVVYTGTYTSPPGQTVTRFIFQSASTWNGDGSVGNFLDKIEFTADNGVLSVSPTALTCIDNVTTVTASGSGEWSAHLDNPAPTEIADAESNTTTIGGFTASGTYRFEWTTQYCSSTVEVTYDNGSVPEPIVVTPVDYCVGETAVPLSATPLADHTLNWYTVAAGGTAVTTPPTPDTTTNSVTIYYVAQQSALNCESPRVPIEVTVHAVPNPPAATAAVEYCQDFAATPLTATALTGNTLNWYTVATGGTADTTAPTPNTSVASVGTTSYYVSQVSAFGCESERTEIVVTVNASVVPVTEFTIVSSICIEDTDPAVVPDANQTAGGFYSADAGLVINPATGEVNLSASTPGTYNVTYTVAAQPALCNIGGSTTKEIIVTPLADAVTGFSYSTPVCTGTASQLPVLTTGFTTGGTFTADGGLVIDAVTGEINIAASTAGDYTITYTVDQSIANCVSAGISNTNLTITQVFTPVLGFDYDDSFCFGASDTTPNLATDFTAGGTFTGTNGLVIDAVTGVVNITASTSGTHTVTYTFAGDPLNCIEGGSSLSTFTIGNEVEFAFNGECEGSAYVLTAIAESGTFDDNDPTVSFRWTTAAGTTVGTDSYIINVSDYAASTPENDTFPLELNLTVIVNGCETTRTYVIDGISCTIQKGISPNNDGYNDYFDLEFMGVKKLSIFNRYGQEVYTKGNYKNEWIGQGKNGNELPTGTYYYVIERSAGGTDTGWIYINRQD